MPLRWCRETSERTAEIKDLRQLIADDTSPAQRINYRAAEAQAESDRLAAIAKVEADRVARWQAWTIPGYDHWVDRRGGDIPHDREGEYLIVGRTTLPACIAVINHNRVLG